MKFVANFKVSGTCKVEFEGADYKDICHQIEDYQKEFKDDIILDSNPTVSIELEEDEIELKPSSNVNSIEEEEAA